MAETSKPYVIVVGVDYSETGDLAIEQALEIGAAQARISEARVKVHAVSVAMLLLPPIDGAASSSFQGGSIDEAKGNLEAYLSKKLEELAIKLGPTATIPRPVAHIRLEEPAHEIAQIAADLEADLVVVGTHGRRGLARAFMGSVAEGVVRLAPCPVLVVRPKRVVPVVAIAPPCPECLATRRASNGEQLWCPQHSERHGQRHTYHGGDRVSADGSMPMVFHG